MDARLEATPARSVHPHVQGACRPGLGGCRGGRRKGLRGGGGCAAGAGPAVPALSCGARLLPTGFFSPRLLGPSSAPPAPEPPNPHFLGEEDTPALVEKTFPADLVEAVVAGSPGSDLSPPPAALVLPGTRAKLEIKFSGPLPGCRRVSP